MATDTKKKATRSESLTIRLDPKTRFMLDFVARQRGQPLTTVVERAITEAASNVTVYDGNSNRTWKDFWDTSEGVRALSLATVDEIYPTYEEERRLAFAKEHEPFFYGAYDSLKRINIDILWPDIDDYIATHEEKKQSDYFFVGKAMREALQDAGLAAPEWPPKAEAKKASRFDDAMKDDIPF